MADLLRLPDATLVAVRCGASVLDAIGTPAGLDFPRTANRLAVTGTTTVLWTGPDDWLVIAGSADVLPAVEAAFAPYHAAVVDMSGNRVRFALSGEGARDMMARACSLDLEAPGFGSGHCAGTIVARAQAFILQRTEAPAYELLVRRSYARYLRDWFTAAGCSATV